MKKLKTQDEINEDLASHETEESEFQKALLEYLKPLLKVASDKMCDYHDSWEKHDWIYRGYRFPDRDDKEAASKNEPVKVIVPTVYAQIQTALSFEMATYMEREHFYELKGRGPEDEKFKFALEEDISYQLLHNSWPLRLYCSSLDKYKYGFGINKIDWTEHRCQQRIQRKEPIMSVSNLLGGMFKGLGGSYETKYRTIEAVEEVLKYQGSRIRTVSPFAFYPDPDIPLARFQDGAFVAHEEEISLAEAEKGEGTEYFGTQMIPSSVPQDVFTYRRRWAGRGMSEAQEPTKSMIGADQKNDSFIRTEIQFHMSVKRANEKFHLNLPKTDNYPEKWLAVIGNDMKIIAFGPLNYLHGLYTYAVTEYSPDANAFVNPGMAETLHELQNLISFFLNSHVFNVRRILKNRLIYNPTFIESEDLRTNADNIRTKGSAPADLARIVQQLQVSDVTRNHVSDMDTLITLEQLVTGVSDNALGQYASGRRSATEAKNVNAGAAARLKMGAIISWSQGHEPMGQMLIANTRQSRTQDVYEQIVGEMAAEAPFEQVILADPNKIAGRYDFTPFDASMPSDRAYQAGMLTELFKAMISNPEVIQIIRKDPMALLEHIAKLSGVKDLKMYDLAPPPMPMAVPGSEEEVAQAIDQGAEPVDPFGNEMFQQANRMNGV